MNVLNPETKDENKVVEQGEKPDLALETIRKIQENKISFDDVKDEKLLKDIHERFIIEEEEIPESPEVEGKKEEPESKIENKELESNTEENDNQEFLQNRKNSLDELNKITQKINSGNKELERLEGLKTEKKKTIYEDPLSEEAVQNLNERVNRMEASESKFRNDQSVELQKSTKELGQEKLMLELQVFQGDNNLKMSKPLKTIDAQYKTFLGAVGGVDNAGKFFTDPKYKEQRESEGVAFTLDKKDFDKYQTIVNVNEFKNNGNYPTFSSAFADYSAEKGIVHDKIKQTAINAANDTVEKMTTQQNSATTLNPEDGGGTVTQGEMSKQEMVAFLSNLPDNPTLAQEAKAKAIHKKLFP